MQNKKTKTENENKRELLNSMHSCSVGRWVREWATPLYFQINDFQLCMPFRSIYFSILFAAIIIFFFVRLQIDWLCWIWIEYGIQSLNQECIEEITMANWSLWQFQLIAVHIIGIFDNNSVCNRSHHHNKSLRKNIKQIGCMWLCHCLNSMLITRSLARDSEWLFA